MKHQINVLLTLFGVVLGAALYRCSTVRDEPDPPASPEAQVIIDSLARLDGWEIQEKDWVVHQKTGVQIFPGPWKRVSVRGIDYDFSRTDKRHIWHAAHRARHELNLHKLDLIGATP